MHAKRIVVAALSIFLMTMTVPASSPAQEQKADLEAFRSDLATFWPQLLSVVRDSQNMAALFGVPRADLAALSWMGSQDIVQVEEEIAGLSNDELAYLKQQYDLLPGWQQAPTRVTASLSPELRQAAAQLAALSPTDQSFPPLGPGFTAQVCGVINKWNISNSIQTTQSLTDGFLISANVAEGIYIIADTACMSYPCSVLGIFDIVPAIAGKLSTCGVATALNLATKTIMALYENAFQCEYWTLFAGTSARLDEKLSTVAADDSAGIRTGGDPFSNESIHVKLEDRLDVAMTTRSTQDSVDGTRDGRPPSHEKSVRTVVDHTDLVRLPQLEKTIDETLELASKQGELMRNFRDLLIRMQIESDLIDSGKSFREAMFQLPKTIDGHKRAFCQRDIAVPCIAAGPDLDIGTDDDVTDDSLCPDDSKPAELCDSSFGVCSRTRATPCHADGDCPGGETCESTSHPCTVTRENECSFDEDCPTGRPKQICIAASPQRGFIELVREIVQEAINMTAAAGEQTYNANLELARADALIAGGDLKNGYTRFRHAYKEAVKIGRSGH